MQVIDADSQFRVETQMSSGQVGTNELVQTLTKDEKLVFRHWEIGGMHSSFALLLRKLDESDRSSVIDAIKEHAKKYLGDADVLIYPGDSPAIHFATQIAHVLAIESMALMANPAFRAHGRHELRLEMNKDQESKIRDFDARPANRPINVVFFDASRSSGQTEERAAQAFIQTRLRLRCKKRKIRWLGYSVLRRGEGILPGRTDATKRNAPMSKLARFDSRQASYCEIGPESIAPSSCALCQASNRVRAAGHWAQGARPEIRRQLRRLENFLEVRSIERHDPPPLAWLDPSICSELLGLSSIPMPDACVRIWLGLEGQPGIPNRHQHFGFLLFVGLNFSDCGSYLALDDVRRLVLDCAERVESPDSNTADAFFFALSILPASLVRSCASQLIDIFLTKQLPDFCAVVMSLAFSCQQHLLVDFVLADHREARVDLARKSQSILVTEIDTVLEGVLGGDRDLASVCDVVRTDVQSLRSPPRDDRPEWVASMLAALLQPGKHPCFLSEQLATVNTDTLRAARAGLIQALDFMNRLPRMIIENERSDIEKCLSEIKAFNSTSADIEAFKNVANRVVSGLWLEKIHADYFWKPAELWRRFCIQARVPVSKYATFDVESEHLLVEECPGEILPVKVFGPAYNALDSLFNNLVCNPFYHFPLVRFRDESRKGSRKGPLVVCFAKKLSSRFAIVVADSGPEPDLEKLFAGGHGLSNSRAMMQVFGGDVEYVPTEDGLTDAIHGLEGLQYTTNPAGSGLQLRDYKNLFVASFPIVLRSI